MYYGELIAGMRKYLLERPLFHDSAIHTSVYGIGRQFMCWIFFFVSIKIDFVFLKFATNVHFSMNGSILIAGLISQKILAYAGRENWRIWPVLIHKNPHSLHFLHACESISTGSFIFQRGAELSNHSFNLIHRDLRWSIVYLKICMVHHVPPLKYTVFHFGVNNFLPIVKVPNSNMCPFIYSYL